jgi:hypothetical protein
LSHGALNPNIKANGINPATHAHAKYSNPMINRAIRIGICIKLGGKKLNELNKRDKNANSVFLSLL